MRARNSVAEADGIGTLLSLGQSWNSRRAQWTLSVTKTLFVTKMLFIKGRSWTAFHLHGSGRESRRPCSGASPVDGCQCNARDRGVSARSRVHGWATDQRQRLSNRGDDTMVTTMQRAPVTERETTSSLIASDSVEGTAVYDAQGKRIGKVERLVIDKAGGRVTYAVLSFGGFLGIGADHYPIPWPMLDYDEKLGGYRVDVTEEQLKKAPKLEQGESFEQANRDRDEKVHGYWEQPAQERQASSLITSDKVEGLPVYDAHGKRIGRVERLMIDKLTGEIAYAVLSFGGFLGIGEDHYPIPWPMLTYNEKPDGFQLDVTEEQLKSAPKIEQGENWEQTNHARNRDVYDYWEVRYYWLVE
jgi:sporulation protein YlmC with PRC-barrel domain